MQTHIFHDTCDGPNVPCMGDADQYYMDVFQCRCPFRVDPKSSLN